MGAWSGVVPGLGGAWSRGVPGLEGLVRRVPGSGEVPALGGGAWSLRVPGPRGVCLVRGVPGLKGAWWRPPGRLLLRVVRILLECILVMSLCGATFSMNKLVHTALKRSLLHSIMHCIALYHKLSSVVGRPNYLNVYRVGRDYWMNLVPATGRPNNPSASSPETSTINTGRPNNPSASSPETAQSIPDQKTQQSIRVQHGNHMTTS